MSAALHLAVAPTAPAAADVTASTVAAPRRMGADPAAVASAVAALRGAAFALHRPLDDAEADALATIYVRYGAMMLATARRALDACDDAEDVVHDVFARLPRLLAQYRGHGLGGWLRQIVRNEALMLRRRAHARRETGGDDAMACVTAPQVEPADDELTRAIAGLPPALREVVVLRHFVGCSHREVGELLDITATASEVRLCRAVQRLRLALRALASGAAAPRPPRHESIARRAASSC